jgi:quinol-cytochrome oxidoreductase complex cytochrome b subunit
MSENKEYKAGLGSDFSKDPVRVVFITKKTSAKVQGTARAQIMSYPHVILREMIAFQLLTIVLVLISLFWDAPLEQLANPLLTPNPAKAPWYFLGLQEMLHYFPPIVAGVLIPVLVIIALVVIPYFFINIHVEPFGAGASGRQLWIFAGAAVVLLIFFGIYEAWAMFAPTVLIAVLAISGCIIPSDRGAVAKFLRSRTLPWWLMTWFIITSITLTVVGTLFRGPGWSWVWPWR